MSQAQQLLTISPVSAWTEGEPVKLPSGRVMRLRQLDILSVIDPNDNTVPNFLLPMIMAKQNEPQTKAVTGDDLVKLMPLMNQVAQQAVTEPAIVDNIESVRAGEGILLSMIPTMDKSAILSFCMGGVAAVEAATRFQPEQTKSVAAVPTAKQRVTE